MNSILLAGFLAVLLPFVQMGEIITSPPITNWGDWGIFDHCPNGTFVQGFQLKTEPYKGLLVDDSSGNAIKLFCGDPLDSSTVTIQSSEGNWGDWGAVFSCGVGGYIYGFQLRVEQFGVIDDETATNNVGVFCTNNKDVVLEGDGLTFGTWRDSRKCATTQALCAIQTQVQPNQLLGDDTSLNNIAAECCDLPLPTTQPPTTIPTTIPTTAPTTTAARPTTNYTTLTTTRPTTTPTTTTARPTTNYTTLTTTRPTTTPTTTTARPTTNYTTPTTTTQFVPSPEPTSSS